MDRKSVLFFGFYHPKSPRTWTLRKTYEKEGLEVRECQTNKKGFARKCFDLIKQFKQHSRGVSEMVVLFPGHHLMPLAWILTRFPRKKLTFDVFISVYDTLVSDRKKVSQWNPLAFLYYLVDYVSCHLADEVLIDTQTHREFFLKKFNIHPKRIRVVYLETRTDLFKPCPSPSPSPTCPPEPWRRRSPNIFFYGSFIPLQGIEIILQAAKSLQDRNVNAHFTLLGGGQTKPQMLELAQKLFLKNVTFKEFVPLEELPRHINEADLCLGIFGASAKAQRVIPHKVLDYRACGKKVITERSPAMLEKFANDPGVILCDAGNPDDLVTKITDCLHEILKQKG